MTRHRVRARDYVEHMREACDKILEYTAGKDFPAFTAETLIQDAVLRKMEVLGEACSQLLQVLPEAETRFPDIPFRTIYSTRNRLIHGYHTLELQPIWSIVDRDILPLREMLASWPNTFEP